MPTAQGIGARIQRVEDPRFLRGETTYVEGLRLQDMRSVAFVRSQHAHGILRSIDVTAAATLPGVERIVTGADLAGDVKPILFDWQPKSLSVRVRNCEYPTIAVDRVRFAGEIVAIVVARDRYIAEDAAELVRVDVDPLPAVVDMERALEPGAPLVHEEWGDNLMLDFRVDTGDVDRILREAPLVVTGRYRTNRQSPCPMEGRAVLAGYDATTNELTVWLSTQMPHFVRTEISRHLGFPENRIRVIAPDVGGGFGLKCNLFPEELLLAALARKLRVPLKWVEDRRENFVGSYHAKEAICEATLALDRDGKMLALDAYFVTDVGAYTSVPFSPTAEALQLGVGVPGPYKIAHVRTRALAVATNKVTESVYRGVGFPASQYTMEHLVDQAAAELGIDPAELRRRNLIPSSEFPFTSATGLRYDSATPEESLDLALRMIDYERFREEQAAARAKGRYLGLGLSTMIEMTTFGLDFFQMVEFPRKLGFDSAQVRVEPDGRVTLAVGTFSHGQGHATTFAQIVAETLGCDVADVTFVQGDTARTPYGCGTWGSRSAVAGGGAVLGASEQIRAKLLRVAGHLLETAPQDLELRDGKVNTKGVPGRSVTLRQVAEAVLLDHNLPPGETPGLDAVFHYTAPSPFANATHLAVVEVDPETGAVRILRYVVAEDCGRMINPMIVDGQIVGGVAQGIAMALLEEHRYDENGQLLTGSLLDYLLPTAADVPQVEIGHIETPCPLSAGGFKGMGEGGTIAPPGAIANAVSDALVPLCGWKSFGKLPITPEIVRRRVQEARNGG